MARQAPSLNKLLVWLLPALCFAGCENRPAKQVYIDMDNTRFKQVQGTLNFNNIPFTGCTYELFANGDTAKIIPYTNGKQNGIMKWWYSNQQLAQQRFFTDGYKEGIHRGWWPNGQLKFEYHFNHDEYEGEVKEWFQNGRLFRLFHYSQGHEEGSEKMWWEDGRIRANYVIVNGEKFGLFGQKLCVNNLSKP